MLMPSCQPGLLQYPLSLSFNGKIWKKYYVQLQEVESSPCQKSLSQMLIPGWRCMLSGLWEEGGILSMVLLNIAIIPGLVLGQTPDI